MPRVFKPVDISKEEKEVRKDYFDRHTPHIICNDTAERGKKLKVKVILGNEYVHPDENDHYIAYVQLWNRETFLAETHFAPGNLGNLPGQIEVDFYIVPPINAPNLNLSAMSVCTKHGLWQSEEKPINLI